ncbi:hypothetical protein B0H12DRAFT_1099493 [Mycena haematopus]|nr:hypothetical protein B0H12DRAFT_1099493 [Mycena haematopus]
MRNRRSLAARPLVVVAQEWRIFLRPLSTDILLLVLSRLSVILTLCEEWKRPVCLRACRWFRNTAIASCAICADEDWNNDSRWTLASRSYSRTSLFHARRTPYSTVVMKS